MQRLKRTDLGSNLMRSRVEDLKSDIHIGKFTCVLVESGYPDSSPLSGRQLTGPRSFSVAVVRSNYRA